LFIVLYADRLYYCIKQQVYVAFSQVFHIETTDGHGQCRLALFASTHIPAMVGGHELVEVTLA
jgi:hypothetical protein